MAGARVVRHPENRGLGAALNTGLDHARGDLVAYLPVDDVWRPGHLAALLMHRLIDHARRRGVREIFGHVLRENRRMLGICRRLGFREAADPETPWVTVVRLAL